MNQISPDFGSRPAAPIHTPNFSARSAPMGIDPHRIRDAILAKRAQIDAVRSGQHGLLVARAESTGAKVEARAGAALKSVAANEAWMPRPIRNIAKANHVDAIGAMRSAR